MVQDPYKVLGVDPGATQDEIKRAYRKKAKENHPDLHPDDPNATQKMNEINEAYDMAMNPDKFRQRREQEQARQQARQSYTGSYGGGAQGGYQGSYQGSQGNPFGGQGGWQEFDFNDFFGFGFGQQQQHRSQAFHRPGETDQVRRAVDALNMGQYQQATVILNGVTSAGRDAHWYYLSALAAHGTGSATQAMDFARRAVQMDPNNLDYKRFLQQLQNAGQEYERSATGWGMNNGMNSLCLTFCAANLLCSLCGRGYVCCY